MREEREKEGETERDGEHKEENKGQWEMMRELEVMPLFLLCVSLRFGVLLLEYLRASESLQPPGP